MLLRMKTPTANGRRSAIAVIIDGMKWLGLDWDGETIFQFARADRHREVAEQMLASGAAYKCYASPDELNEMRELARKEGRPPRYDGRWRELCETKAEARAIAEGRKPVVRLKAPREGETVIEDKVREPSLPQQGSRRSRAAAVGFDPTYMLAVVVDDHDMGVTQIIRGDDHLTNAARQTHIYQAMGWEIPGWRNSADPRPRRRENVEAPRRARRRRLPGARLSAGSAAQLSGATRLEPGRPRILLDAGAGRGLFAPSGP